MQKKNKLILSIDTSNYTTSVAITDKEKNIVFDRRIALKVKQGERGLRQSDALFQHMENLPGLLEEAFADNNDGSIAAIAVSDKPRPISDSYMPVFRAGLSFGRTLAAGLSVPFFTFSHQEGHIAAASLCSDIKPDETILAFHLSGGTCELLLVSLLEGKIEKLGGTKDISFGQVLDRLGVAMGLSFPAGKEMDQMANTFPLQKSLLKPIPFDALSVNLSGIETQALRLLENKTQENAALCTAVFIEISNCLSRWTQKATSETGIDKVLFSGGVSASAYIRNAIRKQLADSSIDLVFGKETLASDNAVGIALLGGDRLWQ